MLKKVQDHNSFLPKCIKKPTQEQLSKHTDWIDKTHFVSSQALCIMSKYNVSIMLKSLRAANGQ